MATPSTCCFTAIATDTKYCIFPVPDCPLVWVGSSLEVVRGFPVSARRLAGHQLHRIQGGAAPLDWKPMPAVGAGVRELRIRAGSGQAFRILYLATSPSVVYVLHAFEKRTRRISTLDLRLARQRLRESIASRYHREE